MAFGGIQLVLSGDFFQLPPVPDKTSQGGQVAQCFAFEAESWDRCVGPPFVLTKVFRQKDQGMPLEPYMTYRVSSNLSPSAFVNMLNAMRWGRIDEVTTRAFRALEREVTYDDGIQPTEL